MKEACWHHIKDSVADLHTKRSEESLFFLSAVLSLYPTNPKSNDCCTPSVTVLLCAAVWPNLSNAALAHRTPTNPATLLLLHYTACTVHPRSSRSGGSFPKISAWMLGPLAARKIGTISRVLLCLPRVQSLREINASCLPPDYSSHARVG